MTDERIKSGRADLVTARDLAGPSMPHANFGALNNPGIVQLTSAMGNLADAKVVRDRIEAISRELHARNGRNADATTLTKIMTLHQFQTLAAAGPALGHAVKAIWEDLRDFTTAETGAPFFQHAGAHVVVRDDAILHRSKLPSILLRLSHDEDLRNADLTAVAAAGARDEMVFAASSGLSQGVMLMQTYFAPLYGCASPFVWSFR